MTFNIFQHKWWMITYTRNDKWGKPSTSPSTDVIEIRPVDWLINENEDRARNNYSPTILNFAMMIKEQEFEEFYYGKDAFE